MNLLIPIALLLCIIAGWAFVPLAIGLFVLGVVLFLGGLLVGMAMRALWLSAMGIFRR